ncbi:MAG: hypothetical protein Q7K39_03995, partial [Candidatus Magasanikbacteria bacterium]|nr:hypothetical protein [Candidatus Magasanikbacteria bacterium]
KPVTLYSPYYLGGMNFYQNKTTGQLYYDVDGQYPVSAGYVTNLKNQGYYVTNGLSYFEALNTGVVAQPLIEGGGSVVTEKAAATYLANQTNQSQADLDAQMSLAPLSNTKPLSLLDRAINFVSDAYNYAKQAVSWVVNKITPVIQAIPQTIAKTVKAAAAVISNVVSAVVSRVQSAVASVSQFSSQVNTYLTQTVNSVASKVSYVYDNTIAGVRTFLGRLGW